VKATRADVCVLACAEAWRGDGEIMASPFGVVPLLGAKLARATFAPDLLLSDGEARFLSGDAASSVEGWIPYRKVFDMLWWGRRHVMMGATQIDRYGNQNISCLGDWARPSVQLVGVRGAPGNTVNHPTSYWVPNHSTRVFVERVDMVCGVGYDRAAKAGASATRYHEIRLVVSNLGVFDFATPDRGMRIRSLHPGVSLDEVRQATGFPLSIPPQVPQSREPTAEELELIAALDPEGRRFDEVPEATR
jgi:acyl CoA:acetate/3-ketoacid CoA transferase beta subunit